MAALVEAMGAAGVKLRTCVRVGKINVQLENGALGVQAELGDGTTQEAEMFLYTIELIHYGMELVEGRRDLRHVIGAVFNFPTLHELYKRAAYEAWEIERRR